jgi:hypothetical protein
MSKNHFVGNSFEEAKANILRHKNGHMVVEPGAPMAAEALLQIAAMSWCSCSSRSRKKEIQVFSLIPRPQVISVEPTPNGDNCERMFSLPQVFSGYGKSSIHLFCVESNESRPVIPPSTAHLPHDTQSLLVPHGRGR